MFTKLLGQRKNQGRIKNGMNNNKIKSPEQLNSYIRVTSPGIWFILSAIMLFLAGFFVWIFVGELEISFPTYVYTDGNNSLAFMTADKALQLKKV